MLKKNMQMMEISINYSFLERDLEELRHAIDPLQDDDAYGINTYLQVCLFVRERLY